jgi:hypothetical protein
MSNKVSLLDKLSLRGLEIAPSQVYGGIRLVPLLRSHFRPDLRLRQRRYREEFSSVAVEGKMQDPEMSYISYIPHGLVLSWDEGTTDVAFGTQLQRRDGKVVDYGCAKVRLMHRMAKRESETSLRFMPMHLAMEGFLGMFFSGPAIAWQEYSRQALSEGLGSRGEMSYSGRAVGGFADALRVFEIHENQVGVLVFVADAIASAFIVPNPQDYRALHSTLLEDFYGELIFQYGLLYDTPLPMDVAIEADKIQSLEELRKAVAEMRSHWGKFQGFMAGDLLGRSLKSQRVYTLETFGLQRFITELEPKGENHIGEAIISEDGEIQYLKTYRLSAAQTRRVYLLSQLAKHDWNLEITARELGQSKDELVLRLEKAGFGYLLKQNLLEVARKNQKKGRR